MAIIIANVIVYMAVLISGKSDQFIYYLGLIPHYFANRPWTIFTSMFIHIGFWHIFGNMITLFFFGSFLSKLVGNGKFLLVYLIGGIAGNALYLLLGQDLTPVIGASGAVYAIAGALAVMMPKLSVRLYFLIPVPLWVVVLVFFGIWSIPNLIPGIAWQDHLGGIAVGLIAGFIFRKRVRYDFYR